MLSFSLSHLFIRGCKLVILHTRAYDIAHDENTMSSLIIRSIYWGQVESSCRCSITKCALQNFAMFTGQYLCWSLFLMNNFKATLLKRDSNKGIFFWIFLKIISKILNLKQNKNKNKHTQKKYNSHIYVYVMFSYKIPRFNNILKMKMFLKSELSSRSENGPVTRDHMKTSQMRNKTPLQL